MSLFIAGIEFLHKSRMEARRRKVRNVAYFIFTVVSIRCPQPQRSQQMHRLFHNCGIVSVLMMFNVSCRNWPSSVNESSLISCLNEMCCHEAFQSNSIIGPYSLLNCEGKGVLTFLFYLLNFNCILRFLPAMWQTQRIWWLIHVSATFWLGLFQAVIVSRPKISLWNQSHVILGVEGRLFEFRRVIYWYIWYWLQ
jgi:hypothetical protein